jgi:streptogramin lyase
MRRCLRPSVLLAISISCVAPCQAQSLSPTSLGFGTQAINTTSTARSETLKNSSTVPLAITAIGITGDFAATSACPISPSLLRAGASCTIAIKFTPTALGTRTGTLSVTDSATNSPQTATLTGSGVLPVTLSPTSLSFAGQRLNSSSSAKNITLKNNQPTPLTIAGIGTTGDFASTSNCPLAPATLANASTCVISVTFRPTGLGTRSGAVNVTDDAPNSPQVSSLSGTGTLTGLSTISITPASPSIAIGTQQQLTATGTFTDGSTQDITNFVTWTSSVSTIASISKTGVVSGLAQGTTTIKASYGTINRSTPLAVTAAPPTLASIAVTPANPVVAKGQTQQFKATGTYSDGSTKDLTTTVSWSSASPSIVSINSAGLATANTPGTASISATSGSVTGSTGLTVNPAVLISIAVTPANSSIAQGTTQQFTATGTFSDGSTLDLTASATWSSSNPGVATVSSTAPDQGQATSLSTGQTTVQAAVAGVNGSTALTVTPAALVSMALTPAIPSIPLGTKQQFSATGTFSDGSQQDVTSICQWSSSNSAIATVSNVAGQIGLASSVGSGVTTVTALSGTISASTTLTVSPPALISIAVNPQNLSIAFGTTQQFTATGTYSDGSTQDLTTAVTWSSSDSTVSSISNTTGSEGLATTVNPGTALITASSGSVTGSSNLIVTAAPLVSISVTPQSTAIGTGTSQQFTASGMYADGTIQDVTTTVHWSSLAANVATISNSAGTAGLATSTGAGTTTITADSGPVSGTASLTVSAATLTNIAISPTSASIALGGTQPFTATGTYSDGSSQDVTTSVTWSSSTATVATINNNGMATSAGTGSTTISAASGQLSAMANLTVTGAVLVGIAVSPPSPSISLGTAQQFTAMGSYSDGGQQDVTASAQWTSTNVAVASVSNAGGTQGLATSTGSGLTSIGASVGTISGSSTLTVAPAALLSIAVTPQNPSIALGTNQPFTATGTFTDGSSQNLTRSVVWNSNDTTVVSINSSGVATGVGAGNASVTAALSGISGSTQILVTPATLVTISVTPTSASISLGGTQQFIASGSFSDGTNQNVTTSVHWSSSIPSVATVSNTAGSNGLASSTGVGVSSITATSPSVSGSANLTVTSNQLTITEFPLAPSSSPGAICKGPDGALWLTEEGTNKIARMALDGSINEWTIPTATPGLGAMETGPDGNLYFTEFNANKVGRFNPLTSQFTEWLLPQAASGPGGVVTGADGNLWIMEAQTSQIVRLTTNGVFLPAFNLTAGSWPHGPVLGPDGNIWFAELKRNRIARITTAGTVTEFVLPQANSNPETAAAGGDGNIYFTENQANKIGRIDLKTFALTQWAVPTAGAQPAGIVAGINGNLYFTERLGNNIGLLPLSGGTITEYPVPTPASQPDKITLGPDGNVWFTEQGASRIGLLF